MCIQLSITLLESNGTLYPTKEKSNFHRAFKFKQADSTIKNLIILDRMTIVLKIDLVKSKTKCNLQFANQFVIMVKTKVMYL